MKIDDPDIVEKVKAHYAKKKAEYLKKKGEPEPQRMVSVTVCGECKAHRGTFKRDAKGVMRHLNCPGKPPEKTLMQKITSLIVDKPRAMGPSIK